MRPTTAADRQGATRERIAVATPLEPEVEDELSRVSWPRTIVRLALDPAQHPWRRGWALRRRAPLYLAVLAVLLLLLLAAAGCASPPTQSLFGRASTPPPPSGARCETIVVSQELQVPPEGELADLRLTVDNIPEVVGKLRALVRRPRFGSDLLLEADRPPEFDKVLEVNAQRQLTVVLVEQNAALALEVADHGYVMENGRVVLEGPAEMLRRNPDVKEFYLGLNEAGTRRSYHDVKRYRRRKRWLS